MQLNKISLHKKLILFKKPLSDRDSNLSGQKMKTNHRGKLTFHPFFTITCGA